MAERIIDALEVVDIDDTQPCRLARVGVMPALIVRLPRFVDGRQRQQPIESFVKRLAVQQPGQGIEFAVVKQTDLIAVNPGQTEDGLGVIGQIFGRHIHRHDHRIAPQLGRWQGHRATIAAIDRTHQQASVAPYRIQHRLPGHDGRPHGQAIQASIPLRFARRFPHKNTDLGPASQRRRHGISQYVRQFVPIPAQGNGFNVLQQG